MVRKYKSNSVTDSIIMWIENDMFNPLLMLNKTFIINIIMTRKIKNLDNFIKFALENNFNIPASLLRKNKLKRIL